MSKTNVPLHPVVRPSWMTGTTECDWAEDSSYENGNYFNQCVSCACDFIGHQRRHVCRKCHYGVHVPALTCSARIVNAASEEHRAQMERIANFCGAEEVAYKDLGNGEDYTLTRGDKVLVLQVRGNRVDGAFMCIHSGTIKS